MQKYPSINKLNHNGKQYLQATNILLCFVHSILQPYFPFLPTYLVIADF